MLNTIYLYADGGCRGNQYNENVGAWAYYLKFGDYTKKESGREENTTNNRMELLAVIKGLEAITNKESFPIEVCTDSQYVSMGAEVWSKEWEKKGWRKVKNQDLWQRLLELKRQCRAITFRHVNGHAGVPLNELVDKMCNDEMDKKGG